MGSAGTIQGSFGWDNNPLLQGMDEADGIVTRGAAKIERRLAGAQRGFQSLFKRTPGRRAELALSNLAGSLAGGDIAGAVTSFSTRLSGLGLAAGVGIGVAVTLFEKFHKQIEETKASHEALLVEMQRHPLSKIASLSSEGMGQAIETREKLLEDLRQKSEHTFGSELAETFKELLVGPSLGAIGGKDNGKERTQIAKDIDRAAAEKKQIAIDRGRKELVHANVLSAITDPKRRERAEMAMKFDEREAALRLNPDKGTAARVAALNVEWDEYLKKSKLSEKSKEAQLKMEEQLVALQHKGLGGEELKRVRAGLEIKRLDEEIVAETSPEARRQLRLERSQKLNEAHGLLAAPGPSNPFPFGTASSRGFESQFGFGGFARRGIEDSLGFEGLARGSLDRGDSLTPEEALLKTGTSAVDIAGFRKNVGDLPGGKAGDTEVVAILTEVKNIIERAWAQ